MTQPQKMTQRDMGHLGMTFPEVMRWLEKNDPDDTHGYLLARIAWDGGDIPAILAHAKQFGLARADLDATDWIVGTYADGGAP